MNPPLSCLLLLLLCRLLLSASAEPVFDTDDEELRRGQSYYAVPATYSRQRSGGLTPETVRNHSCPYRIMQAFNRRSKGVPISFLPVDSLDQLVIQLGSDVNIKFEEFPAVVPCPESSVWRVDFGAPAAAEILVTTGGVEGSPGPNTAANWFKIQEFEDAYAIQYCPTPTASLFGDSPVCENLGVSAIKGKKLLVLSQQPFKVAFERLKRCAQLVATS